MASKCKRGADWPAGGDVISSANESDSYTLPRCGFTSVRPQKGVFLFSFLSKPIFSRLASKQCLVD